MVEREVKEEKEGIKKRDLKLMEKEKEADPLIHRSEAI